MRRRAISIVLAVLAARPSTAQIVLPGAEPPAPVGTTERPAAPRPKPRSTGEGTSLLKGAPILAPGTATLVGKPLLLNGATSEIEFAARGEPPTVPPKGGGAADVSIVVTRLSLQGELISKPGDRCRVDVKAASIATKALGRPAGLVRLQLDLASCPFSFDVLDGAILTTKETQTCAFKEADCQVGIGGMWGPKGADIGAAQIKDLERSRATADKASREAFHELLKRTKGKPEIKRVAAEQAAFSSLREETCRTYAQESVHGFCSTRLTEARVTALQTQVEAAPSSTPKRSHKSVRD